MDKLEAINTMKYGSRSDKFEYLNFLDIAFDTYNRNIENSNDIVEVLIDSALTSEDDELTDEILEVICSAQVSQNLQNVDYKKIALNLDHANEKFIPKYIEILGNTGDKEYAPVILKFKNHSNRYVQESVKDALIELRVSDNE